MIVEAQTEMERNFWSLPLNNRNIIITHGTALMLSDLRNRHFLAASKVKHFEIKYQTSLTHLEEHGLPDNADHEMHEDYIMWHHWLTVTTDTENDITSLEGIAVQGVTLSETRYSNAGF